MMEQGEMKKNSLMNSIGCMADALWELDLDIEGGRLYIWKDTRYPEFEKYPARQYQEFISHYQKTCIYEWDRGVAADYFSVDSIQHFLHGTEEYRRFELRISTGLNCFEWYEVIFRILHEDEGKCRRILIFHRNISTLREAEIIKAVIKGGYDYVMYIEADYNSYIMYSADQTKFMPSMPVVNDNYTESLKQYNLKYITENAEDLIEKMQLPTVLKNLEKQEEYVLYCRVKNGSDSRDKQLCFRFFDRDRHIILLTRVDITEILEEKRQRELLEQALHAEKLANQAKSDFLSRMSHDIRTPMNAIMGMITLAENRIHDQERVKYCLNKISISAKLLLNLLNEVLDMSKIESGKLTLVEEKFYLSDLIHNLIIMMHPEILKKKHTFDVHLSNISHEFLIGDMQRIQQIFMNIMSNAIKYTPDNGKVLLTIRELGYKSIDTIDYEFAFKDNGIGIKEEFLDSIFKPFERAEDPELQMIQGTGLGMAISQSIVELMNGTLTAKSDYGKGSTFTVRLSLKFQKLNLPKWTIKEAYWVLIIEHDRQTAEEITEYLTETGFFCQVVSTEEELQQELKGIEKGTKRYNLFIIDLQFQKKDNEEIIQRLRLIAGNQIYIVAVSYNLLDYEENGWIENENSNTFLLKPVFRSKLLEAVKQLLSNEEKKKGEERKPPKIDYLGKRILLVEDNALNMEIAKEIIESTGILVDTVDNGKAALDKVALSPEHYYDLIFMDIQMPIMNGNEATEKIRGLARSDTKEVPIIAMTANAFQEDIKKAKKAGMNEYLVKPIDIVQLMSILKKWL